MDRKWKWQVETDRKVVETLSFGVTARSLSTVPSPSGQDRCWLLWEEGGRDSCVWFLGQVSFFWRLTIQAKDLAQQFQHLPAKCKVVNSILSTKKTAIQYFVFLLDFDLWARNCGNKCLPFQLDLFESSHVFVREGRKKRKVGVRGCQESLAAVSPREGHR